MAFSPSLGMSQNMHMRQQMLNVPQMIQAQEMLQLPVMALEQRLYQELLENPALEMVELEDEPDFHGESESDDGSEASVDELDRMAENSLSAVDENDYSWDETWDEPAPRSSSSYGDEDAKMEALYNTGERPKSFQEFLKEQLSYLELDEREKVACERIIYSLEDDGYLRIALSELEHMAHEEEDGSDIVFSEDELQAALNTVQSLDPAGVGASDLGECLLLQIQAMPGYAKGYLNFEYRMIDEHLDDIAANRLPKIAKAMSCDLEDVKGVIDFLRNLNPHPGLEYGFQEDLRVVPDVTVLYEEGEFIIRLNQGNLPEVRVSAVCKDAVKAVRDTELKKKLRENIMSAEWIVNAIEQRRRTLMNVTRTIVNHQRDYFTGLRDTPEPLMMQTVADEVKIDISTVSRAVKDKYADTPRGLIALRDMFTRQVGGNSTAAENTSNVEIMEKIRQLIENEDTAKPLKDDQIVKLLKAEGISIVRRTVAKYRKNLGIPSYSQRKSY